MLAEAGERGVEVTAAEAEPAAGEAEEDAERGCGRDVGRSDGERRGSGRGGAAAVVRGPGEGVKAEGNIGKVGPGVGAGAEEVLAVDTFGVGDAAEVAALGEGFPNIAAGVGVVEGDERKDDSDQGAPYVEVEKRGQFLILSTTRPASSGDTRDGSDNRACPSPDVRRSTPSSSSFPFASAPPKPPSVNPPWAEF